MINPGLSHRYGERGFFYGENKRMNHSAVLKGQIRFIFLMLAFLAYPPPLKAADDFQYRQLLTVKLVDTKKVDFQIFSHMRMQNNAKDINFFFVSPQLEIDLWKNLSVGLNYTYANLKSFNPAAGRGEFKIHHRCELEVNPHWEIGDWLWIQTQNRYEFRWIEDQGSDNPRIRQKTQLEFPIKNLPPVKSVYVNTESFYDVNDHRYNENWTVPLGIKFRVSKKASVSAFYMIQSRLSDTWTSAQIFGTSVYVSF